MKFTYKKNHYANDYQIHGCKRTKGRSVHTRRLLYRVHIIVGMARMSSVSHVEQEKRAVFKPS